MSVKHFYPDFHKTLLLGSVLWIASCSVGPDYKRPSFFPQEDVAASLHLNKTAAEIKTDWYRQFNDPLLNSLVSRGLVYSPTVAAATEKLRQARQSLRINAVQNLPTIDADGSYHYVKDSINYGLPVSTDYYQLGLDAGWELDIWGGGRRLTESSLALVRAAGAGLDNVRLTLTAEIAADYINLRQAQEQLRIARENLKLQQSIFELVRDKYNAGLADDIALNQAKYIVDTTRQQIPVFETEVEAYQNALAILTGRLPGMLNAELENPEHNLVSRPFDYDLQRLYNLPVSVIRNRPDVREAENQLIAQNAKIGQAIAEMFPSVSLSGFIGYQSKNLSNLVSSNSYTYSYSPAVSLPLFHWGALYNNVELQKSMTAEQLQLYKSSLLTAAGEIRNAMVSLEKEYKRNQSAAHAENSQKEVAGLTLSKYRQGLVEFNDVLSSQQNLLDSQNARISSNAAIYKDIIAFYKAVGGGYVPRRPKVRKITPLGCNPGKCDA